MKEILNRDFIENFIKYHKKTIIKAFAGVLFFAAAFFVFCIREDDRSTKFELTDATSQVVEKNMEEGGADQDALAVTKVEGTNQDTLIFVDIGGAVKKPYVYKMPSGSRIFEAIEKAGGLTEEADTSTLNLAQVLQDQDKLIVPTKTEIQTISTKTNQTGVNTVGIRSANDNTMNENNDGRVNINTATSEQLQTLSGIGPATAEKIILYRQEQGVFKKIEDIMEVSGIGEKTFEKFKTKIMV